MTVQVLALRLAVHSFDGEVHFTILAELPKGESIVLAIGDDKKILQDLLKQLQETEAIQGK